MTSHGSRRARRPALLAAMVVLLAAPTAAATTTTVIPAEISGGAVQTSGAFTFAATGYTPADVAVVPGSTVSWTGPFAAHPLVFDDGTPGASTGTSFSQAFPAPGHFLFHSPDAGAGELRGSVYVAGPVPKLRATQIAPPDPRVRLDASATDFVAFSQAGGARYEFDADGDGAFDSHSANPILSYRYPGEGSFTARVRVTDDNGFSAETTATVSVTRDGVPPEVDRTAPRLAAAAFVPLGRRALRRGVTLVVGTPSENVTARVTLLRGTSVIAAAKAIATGQRAFTVRLKATKAGARLLLRRKPTSATLRIVLDDVGGNSTTVRRTVRLRRP